MADLFGSSTGPAEPAVQVSGSLYRVRHFAEEARQGRLAALEALRRAEAEVDAYLARQAQARDAEVRAAGEGKVAADPRPTSAQAARTIAPRVGTQRARILAAIVEYGGLTDHELAERLGMLDNSVRPRRTELVSGGFAADSGRVRTHRGTAWVVWEATEEGRAWWRSLLGGAA
ncbi:hypothetical protein FHU38_000954 [Saccharomonospora amisosensis]|uniref:Uncharacterized protein n=1 Tax=Saccharomonospora amisosensis TaxID=1128677 RepID=A0A7X5UM86_9PSEU|nr:hypothetical protein [Saccharomonospora amisosensis]NIJ10610.1 hypothetical protein [Saccharomonospora amisosensis]